MVGKNNFKLKSSSLQPWVNAVRRMGAEPTRSTIMQFNAFLDQLEALATAYTHEDTGRLASSINASSHTVTRPNGDTHWEGSVTVGEGVPYAKYEFARADPKNKRYSTRPDWVIHPSHDPTEGLEVLDPEMDAIMEKIWNIR